MAEINTGNGSSAAGAVNSPGTNGNGERQIAQRIRLFQILGSVIVGAAVIWGFWYLFIGSRYVSTNDAYVQAPVAEITPQVAGIIAAVNAVETQEVKKGDVLVIIDPADLQLALTQAEARYHQAKSRVQQYYANVDAAVALVAARSADLERARVDYKRRRALEDSGAISGDELTIARNALKTAEANLRAAEQELLAKRAMITGPDPEQNPEMRVEKAAWDRAQLDLNRSVIRSPVDGIVARKAVQIGQHVVVGARLMTVVPIADVYVDANFKENQLTDVYIGQSAELTSDIYGSGVVYHGKVAGIGGGTGSAMAIIPAQNATGNWIKIVQRLPVRIELDPKEVAEHPLRVGLSMTAKVDLSRADDE